MVVGPSRAEFLENLELGPSQKNKKIKKKSRPESKKKVGPSQPESGRVGPTRVPSAPPQLNLFQKKKTKKKTKQREGSFFLLMLQSNNKPFFPVTPPS